MIQVSSGLLRGVPLRSPTGNQTRPSSERLRQGTFNVLRNFRWPAAASTNIVQDGIIVDLFAGTGAWGIEAVSNGAAEVWFVESDALATRALQENMAIATKSFEAQSLEPPQLHLVRRDALTAYKKLPEARLIFCDPPYERGYFEKVLQAEGEANRLTVGGLFLYEAGVKEPVPPSSPSLKHYDTKIYGDSVVHFFVKI